jgi:hypothetical protein
MRHASGCTKIRQDIGTPIYDQHALAGRGQNQPGERPASYTSKKEGAVLTKFGPKFFKSLNLIRSQHAQLYFSTSPVDRAAGLSCRPVVHRSNAPKIARSG